MLDYLEVMPNLRKDVLLRETHILPIHSLCPVSNNPKEGSTVEISYTPDEFMLEVYSLQGYIESYRGGRRVEGTFVRDMEQTIQAIKSDCEKELGVSVKIKATLYLDAGLMILEG